ncbi:MAG: serine/threonine protein kinase [Harvfovirus sp.]|uniref:non-specific serine/threonine protein kinase n=1 Tax=Harvfovirus sp. TaxID=2487768 RepID=A0A3G5A3Y9_9VIRU|nr:MAG: serine/threonine protein kinase [Harvfovirus sp.]
MVEKRICDIVLHDVESKTACTNILCMDVHCLSEQESFYDLFIRMYDRDYRLLWESFGLHFGEFLEWLELRNDNRKNVTIFRSVAMIESFSSKEIFKKVLKCQKEIFRKAEGKTTGSISRNMSCVFINAGTYGTVYHVTRFNPLMGELIHYAEKLLKKEPVKEEHEGYIRHQLGTDAIVGLLSYVSFSKNSLLMKYYEMSLTDVIAKVSLVQRTRLLPVIMKQLCNGLLILEKNGFFHNDITPNNILVSGVNACELGLVEAVLGDFGAMRKTSRTKLTTELYRAREDQKDILKPSTDIYSLGLSMIELISSADKIASYGSDPSSIPPDFPLRELLVQMISLDHLKRPSIVNIIKELEF